MEYGEEFEFYLGENEKLVIGNKLEKNKQEQNMKI